MLICSSRRSISMASRFNQRRQSMAERISASRRRKKMRLSVAQPSSGAYYFSDGSSDRSDADDDDQEQVVEGRQRGRYHRRLSESNGDDEEDHERSGSDGDGDDDAEDVGVEEDERRVVEEEENQSDHEPSESDGGGDDEEGAEVEVEENRSDRDRDRGGEEGAGSGGVRKDSPVTPLAPRPPTAARTAAVPNITLDEDMLDCGVCCFPLKPPIYQCDVGHVVCSSCRDKLAAEEVKCHVCCVVIAGGYRRCYAMEQLVESVRRSCPNAPHGCATMTAHYDLHAHLQACPHAKYRCPAADACGGFVGSIDALLGHFTGAAHGWPCTTGIRAGAHLVTNLHDGYNVVAVARDASDAQAPQHGMFLLRVAREPYGRVITSLCLRPWYGAIDGCSSSYSPPLPPTTTWEIRLWYLHHVFKGGKVWSVHSQHSTFKVACADALPSPSSLQEECFQFIIANCVQPNAGAGATVSITACFTVK